jgi:NADH-quinone oxidoreductase subunit J
MIPAALGALTGPQLLASPTFWAVVVGAAGLWLLIPGRLPHGKVLGSALVAVAGGLFAFDLPLLGDWGRQGVFWLLAAVTLGGATATIASQSPLYSAIWFALSLLGTAGLFLFQGAQFLGVATIVVYAGAIVVTFLFVIMLAQPQGNAPYDRMSWGGLPKLMGVATAGALVGILMFMLQGLSDEARPPALSAAVAQPSVRGAGPDQPGGVLDDKHVANLGRVLFSQHLISVEVAGTLLLVALVGAVAIAIRGRPKLAGRTEEALR